MQCHDISVKYRHSKSPSRTVLKTLSRVNKAETTSTLSSGYFFSCCCYCCFFVVVVVVFFFFIFAASMLKAFLFAIFAYICFFPLFAASYFGDLFCTDIFFPFKSYNFTSTFRAQFKTFNTVRPNDQKP